MKKYKNAIGDIFYSERKHKEEMAKLDALNKVASRSTTSSSMVFLILGAAILIGGVIVIVALKRKKS
jgi:LPXTG-motif cell wall-anchored protein